MNVKVLKRILKDRRISLNKLSIMSGVGYATIHSIVNGSCDNPRLNTIIKISNALNINPNRLIGGDGIEKKNCGFSKEEENSSKRESIA